VKPRTRELLDLARVSRALDPAPRSRLCAQVRSARRRGRWDGLTLYRFHVGMHRAAQTIARVGVTARQAAENITMFVAMNHAYRRLNLAAWAHGVGVEALWARAKRRALTSPLTLIEAANAIADELESNR